MAKVKIQGHASGSGVVTVTAPNTSTDRTITLPDATATIATTTDVAAKLNLAGGSMTGHLELNDNVKAAFGQSGDLEIFHDGSHSRIKDVGTGHLVLSGGEIHFNDSSNSNNRIKIDSTGAVTMPAQPAFLANNNSNQTLSNNTVLQFPTERFDQNGDYNNSTYTFTAPVTGKYFFGGMMRIDDISNSGEYLRMHLRTSNADYAWITNQARWDQTSLYTTINVSLLVDMDAADTCKLVWNVGGGGGTPHLDGGLNAAFSGHLVC